MHIYFVLYYSFVTMLFSAEFRFFVCMYGGEFCVGEYERRALSTCAALCFFFSFVFNSISFFFCKSRVQPLTWVRYMDIHKTWISMNFLIKIRFDIQKKALHYPLLHVISVFAIICFLLLCSAMNARLWFRSLFLTISIALCFIPAVRTWISFVQVTRK